MNELPPSNPDDLSNQPETRGRADWTRIAIMLTVLAGIFLYKWDVKAREPSPELVRWDATKLAFPGQKDFSVKASVRNKGGTGPITLFARLTTADGEWNHAETVVVRSPGLETFYFDFPHATGANPQYRFEFDSFSFLNANYQPFPPVR